MAVLNVPVPYTSIAAAVAAASPGDTIVIAAGFDVTSQAGYANGNLDVIISKENLTFDVAAGLAGVSLILQGNSSLANLTMTGSGTYNLVAQNTSVIANVLTGNAGDNFLRGRLGNDTIDGGGNSGRGDWADYRDATGSVTVTLTNATTPGGATGGTSSGADGVDTLINIENIRGGESNDILTGNSGDNWLRGQGGSDTLIGGANGNGGDWADYAGSTIAVTATLTDGGGGTGVQGAWTDTFVTIENLSGSNVADTLTGNAASNWFRGNGGNDVINGADGGDWMDFAGASGSVTATLTDTTNGSGWLIGSSSGADGSDTLYNIENLRGSDFADVLTGNSLGNFLRGRKGDDTLDGGAGSDWADYFNASGGMTVTLVDVGNGSSSGPDGTDILINIENLQGSQYDDVLNGNSANNAFRGREGNDTINGAGGTADMVDYQKASGGVTVTLTDGSGGHTGGTATGATEGTDTLIDIEMVRGSNYADALTGASANDWLRGMLGNDTLNGGANTASGATGTGGDWADYRQATGGMTVTLTDLVAGHTGGSSAGPDGADTLIDIENILGSAYVDTLTGNDQNNTLKGLGGADVVYGMGGRDALIGDVGDYLDAGAGDDVIKIYGLPAVIEGGDGFDVVRLYGNFTLPGSGDTRGVEKILVENGYTGDLSGIGVNGVVMVANSIAGGGAGIVGSAFNDRIVGALGNDLLIGGQGNDTTTGGGGADQFGFRSTNWGQDRITDFQDGIDRIDFRGVASVDDIFDFTILTVSSGVKVSLTADPNQWILLTGVTTGQLTNSDFLFGSL